MDDMQTVLLPTGARSAAAVKSAERPKSLAGLRIGLLDNGKEFSDVVLESLAETLRRDHHATHIKLWRKSGEVCCGGCPQSSISICRAILTRSGIRCCWIRSPSGSRTPRSCTS